MKTEKSCSNCVNCLKSISDDGKESWVCEEYGFYYVGRPVNCNPPNDYPCQFWTKNPRKKNTWLKYVKSAGKGWNNVFGGNSK